MTIELSDDTKDLIERAMAKGGFESAEHVIQYSLGRTLTEADLLEDEAFAARAKAALKRSEEDIKAGRVYKIPHGELADLIAERNKSRVSD